MRPLGRRPGIQRHALFWIPGSLALLAPRNDGFKMDARIIPDQVGDRRPGMTPVPG
jgi:hypothetical protein